MRENEANEAEEDDSKEGKREEKNEAEEKKSARAVALPQHGIYDVISSLTVNNFPRGCERHYVVSRVSPPRVFGRTSCSSIRYLNNLALHLSRAAFIFFISFCKLKRCRRARCRSETTRRVCKPAKK